MWFFIRFNIKKERRLDALPAVIQWRRDPDSNRG
nr:MAG TPA: hypothetical protein [Caudoviricetes sp.]